MRYPIIAFAALLLAAPALAQQTQETQPVQQQTEAAEDTVTITAEDRKDVFDKMAQAMRTAGEARKLFAGVRGAGVDMPMACRKATEADHEYASAISAAVTLAKEATGPVKERAEERVKLMKEQRRNLDNFHDRMCRAGDLGRSPAEVRSGIPGAGRARGGRGGQ